MKRLTIDLKDYRENGTVYFRAAVRGIIRQENKYLLISGKYGDCKFPGGGVESGENLEEALAREIREETGFTLDPCSLRKWGEVTERRKGVTADVTEMVSHYFFCRLTETPQTQQELDTYEREYEYAPVWLTLEEAIEKNRLALGQTEVPWVTRDLTVLKCLRDEDAYAREEKKC
ncbi:MAG: NUDIX domain-containing protein [Acutalibacter sp.]|nr:NUDIX domain-containing protein [Acutalibacter sp.]